MADRINDIAWQAHQGSVAAIIQLLNEKLVESGVRTRAIFSDGVLQLLCEAATVDQLEKTTIVQKIRQILESIAPRNIRRVNINSRIVREQQLLWLTEIYRDRDNQLLWSEEIILPKPNIFRQIVKDFQDYKESKTELAQVSLPKPNSLRAVVFKRKNRNKSKNRFQSKNIPKHSLAIRLIKVSGLCFPLLFLVWGAYTWLGGKQKTSISAETSQSLAVKPQRSPLAATKNPSQPSQDPFAAAVRIANQAFALGKTATTSEQRLELATQWQQASDLMNQVSPNHSRYQEAQSRIPLYKKYAETSKSLSVKREASPSPVIKTLSTPSDDPFAAAVRIANQASASGKTATSSEQWSTLAAKWQEASDLMSQVPAKHSRYQEAQSRILLYKKFAEAAQVQAQKGQ